MSFADLARRRSVARRAPRGPSEAERRRWRRLDDLRHTAASLWLGAGADPKVVQRVLRHAAASMTMDLYGHMIDANLWQAAQFVGGISGASGPSVSGIRTDSGPGTGTKTPRSWSFSVEPPIGIEPMTYALREARLPAPSAQPALMHPSGRSECPECSEFHPLPFHDLFHAAGQPWSRCVTPPRSGC